MASGQGYADAAGRYAAALFELALEERAIDEVAGDLDQVAEMIAASDDLRRLIESPAFSRDDKQAGLAGIAKKAGLSSMTSRFLGVAAGNGRARALPEAIAAFRALVDEHRGLTVAEVAAPRALSDKQVSDIAAALKRAIGKDVEVRASVEPELLGGLVVKVGSRMFDSSIRTKLAGIKAAMKGA